ncbi:hypothetical protein [Thermococcus sp. CX2]|nr:hypothetical protein [Thermococcus sp. CX2]
MMCRYRPFGEKKLKGVRDMVEDALLFYIASIRMESEQRKKKKRFLL